MTARKRQLRFLGMLFMHDVNEEKGTNVVLTAMREGLIFISTVAIIQVVRNPLERLFKDHYVKYTRPRFPLIPYLDNKVLFKRWKKLHRRLKR
jgi:hypothetical protein